eukprot:scaffold28620_cov94-Skeletonema_dohrnii-CCMP3373.AAC.2
MPPPENSKRAFVRQYTDSFSKIDWGSLGGSTRRSIPRQQLPRDFSVGSIDIPSMGDEGGVGVASSGGEKKKGLKDHFKQQQRLSVISSFSSCHEDIEDGQRIGGEMNATRESKSTSSSSSAWCLVLTVLVIVVGVAEYFITFPPNTAILNWKEVMSGDKDQGVFDDTAQEMLQLAEQITAACGESSRSSTGESSCQELCHNHMCCVEQDDEYSCKNDAAEDCAVYAGCVALIDDSYFGER